MKYIHNCEVISNQLHAAIVLQLKTSEFQAGWSIVHIL